MKTHTIPLSLVSIETLIIILTSMSAKFELIRAKEKAKPIYYISSTRANWLKAGLDGDYLNSQTGSRFAARFDTDTVSTLSGFFNDIL